MFDYIGDENDREKAKRNFDRALKGESFSLIEEYGDLKYERKYFEDIYSPIYNTEKEIIGLSVVVSDITKRRKEEVSVFRSEGRFRAIIEGTFEGISVARVRDLKIIYANPAVLEMFGYSEDEFLELYAHDLHRKEDLDQVEKEIKAQASKEKQMAYALPCKRKDQSLFYCNISSVPVILEGEECLVGYFTDISDELEKQKQIRFQESLLEVVGQAIVVTDENDTITYWNKHSETLYGWSREEVIGKKKADIFPLKISEEESRLAWEMLQSGKHWTSDFLVKDKSGREFPILVTSSPIINDSGKLMGFIGISTDISDRKAAEKRLLASENLYKSVISALSEGLVVQNAKDEIVFANDSACEILGLTRDQLTGKSSYDPDWKALKDDHTPFKPEEHPSVIALKQGIPVDNVIMKVHTGKGERKVISINSRPIFDESGKVVQSVTSFTDITEREKTQTILKENESRIKNISNSLPGAILRYKLNTDGSDELLYLSQGAEDLWEIPFDEIAPNSKKIWNRLYPDDVELLRKSIENSARDLSSWDHEWRIKMDDGRIKWLNGRGLPVRQEDGSTIWDSIILEVTDQKETLIKLDESQKLLDSINQNINEGIYRSDKDGVIYVNNAFLKMFGYDSLGEMKKLHPTDIYKNPIERENLVEKINKDGLFENEEVQFVRKDGSVFIGLISSRLFSDHNGKTYWDGAIRDVTEERLSARKIQESQQLLESINRNINEAIYRSVNRKGLIYVNEEFVKMFRYDSVEELTSGNPVNLYKNPEDRRILGDELVDKGSYVNREVEFKRKDGTVFWGSISSIMIEGEDGEIYFDGAIRDITHQKQAELTLKNQAEMQELLRKISSEYINVPLDRVNEAINKSLEELGRFSEADRAYVFDLFMDEKYCVNTYEWCAPGIDSYIDDLQYVPLEELPEVMESSKNGTVLNVNSLDELEEGNLQRIMEEQQVKSLLIVPIMDKDYGVGFVGFDAVREPRSFSEKDISMLRIYADMLLNIRNRAQKQFELKQLLNTTTDQNKRLKEFSFMTSHNIRSSVSNMLGLTRLLEEDPGNVKYIELLGNTAEKLDTTIRNINQILHFENSFQVKEMVECNLLEIVDRIRELHRKTIDEKDISLVVDIPDNQSIYGIPAFLDSIFYNLLSNAFKYGITRNSKTIEIRTEENDKHIKIFVKDMGWGIDLEKYRDKLFKLGSRLHISSDGQGLGLYMTKHQVEELGGQIHIESEVNVGTTFILEFPKYPRKVIAALSENNSGEVI